MQKCSTLKCNGIFNDNARKNIIFVFSGTGNSLWAARNIAKELKNCEIISMGCHAKYTLAEECNAIGFVYPAYYRGVPAKVMDFVLQCDFHNNENAYFFAIATCASANTACNATAQMRNLLSRKGIALSYAEKLAMISNYIISFDMHDASEEESGQFVRSLKTIIADIKKRTVKPAEFRKKLLAYMIYKGVMHFLPRMDRHYRVSDACTHCGICQKVCPVNNIDYGLDKKPYFKHHCEQCLACIHHCPAKAINYKDKTQNRKRYVHPEVSWKDLAMLKPHGMDEGEGAP